MIEAPITNVERNSLGFRVPCFINQNYYDSKEKNNHKGPITNDEQETQ